MMINPTSQAVTTSGMPISGIPTSSPMPPSPISQRRIQQMQMAEMARQVQQQRMYNESSSRIRGHQEEEEEPLIPIPPRSSSKPQIVRSVRPQTPPGHPRGMYRKLCTVGHNSEKCLQNLMFFGF